MVIKKRSAFKILDPVIRRDIYIFLTLFWIVWIFAQCAFIILFRYSVTYGEEGIGGSGEMRLFIGFLSFSSVLFLFALLFATRFLNKITGPIHRMKSDLAKAQEEGSKPYIQLRKEDYFQDLADSINKALGSSSIEKNSDQYRN